MRCVLRPTERMTCTAWHAVPLVCALMLVPAEAFAQLPVCHAVRRGESAAQVARRVTGDGRNAYQAWFQIKNASSRFVPKSQYNRIRAGWQACLTRAVKNRPFGAAELIADETPASTSLPDVSSALGASESSSAAAVPGASASTALAAADLSAPILVADPSTTSAQPGGSLFVRLIRSVNLTIVLLGAAIVVPWFGWRVLDDYLVRRRTTAIVMRHFAHRFVDEFERPLIHCHASERPVRSALRCSVRRGRFDVLLAPGEGRRYPNLLDHKKNVEYDVSRVIGVLADDAFVAGPLYTQAGWIVVPFHLRSGPPRLRAFGASARHKQPGVPCISSF